MKIIGVIPARYKSSRYPGKPLADIYGKPMIWWVYQQANKVAEFSGVYIATDDKRIADACVSFGIHVIMTSPDQPTGTDRVAEVAQKVAADVYINIQGDEPLIEPDALRQVIGAFDDPSVVFATLKNKIIDKYEIESPNTVKVITDAIGDAMYFSRSVIPSGLKGVSGNIYRHVGIYAYRRDILLSFANLPQSALELSEGIEPLRAMEQGIKIRVIETNYASVGVDTPEDLEQVKAIISDSKRYKL
jgi:3-deoxy-manno-octulosonate cytidylyltransferase (CMP-KDO synthetase)